MRTWLQNEISGWKKWEVVWLITACAIIVALSIYWQDTWMGILSATTGAACVICTGKGKLSAYVFGLVNSVLYAIISYQAALYGETMLNALYYVPMQFVGFYTWSRHMNTETNEVIKKNMKWTGRLMMTAFILAGTIGYGLLLRAMGDAMPFVDAFTTVTSVAAMLISVKMFAEQWWIWVVVDIVSVYMWFQSFLQGQEYIATLIMWLVYLVNAVIMLVKWEREAKRNERAAHEI
ncbi:MAG: nicotinamide mononucleotide transporter [Flavonifractor sp.]|nr:nicotinamide mononucleotide transporter [Flavonifractor sp.]MCI9425557.1 nicotinamide mononucleotide transporter [Flavonifractor sp.]